MHVQVGECIQLFISCDVAVNSVTLICSCRSSLNVDKYTYSLGKIYIQSCSQMLQCCKGMERVRMLKHVLCVVYTI